MEAQVSNVRAFGGGSISVWGGISVHREIPLFVLGNNTISAQRYLNCVVPLSREIWDSLVHVNDNASQHRAEVVNDFFNAHGITRMAISWKRCIRSCGVETEELRIIEEWNEISREHIRSLIEWRQ